MRSSRIVVIGVAAEAGGVDAGTTTTGAVVVIDALIIGADDTVIVGGGDWDDGTAEKIIWSCWNWRTWTRLRWCCMAPCMLMVTGFPSGSVFTDLGL